MRKNTKLLLVASIVLAFIAAFALTAFATEDSPCPHNDSYYYGGGEYYCNDCGEYFACPHNDYYQVNSTEYYCNSCGSYFTKECEHQNTYYDSYYGKYTCESCYETVSCEHLRVVVVAS